MLSSSGSYRLQSFVSAMDVGACRDVVAPSTKNAIDTGSGANVLVPIFRVKNEVHATHCTQSVPPDAIRRTAIDDVPKLAEHQPEIHIVSELLNESRWKDLNDSLVLLGQPLMPSLPCFPPFNYQTISEPVQPGVPNQVIVNLALQR